MKMQCDHRRGLPGSAWETWADAGAKHVLAGGDIATGAHEYAFGDSAPLTYRERITRPIHEQARYDAFMVGVHRVTA